MQVEKTLSIILSLIIPTKEKKNYMTFREVYITKITNYSKPSSDMLLGQTSYQLEGCVASNICNSKTGHTIFLRIFRQVKTAFHQLKENNMDFIETLLEDVTFVLLDSQVIFWKKTDQESSFFHTSCQKNSFSFCFSACAESHLLSPPRSCFYMLNRLIQEVQKFRKYRA